MKIFTVFLCNDGFAHVVERSRHLFGWRRLLLILLFEFLNITSAFARESVVRNAYPAVSVSQETIRLPADADSVDLSPDGRWLCCWTYQGGDLLRALWVTSTQSVKWRRVGMGGGHGSWRYNSKQYVFASASQTACLAVISIPSLKIKTRRLPFYNVSRPSWSPDGKYIVAFGDQTLRYDKITRRVLPAKPPVGGGVFFERLLLLNAAGLLLHHYHSGLQLSEFKYTSPSSPQWSQNARQVAYISRAENLDSGPILIFDVKQRRFIQMSKKLPDAEGVFWLGHHLIYNGSVPQKGSTFTSVLAVVTPPRSYRFLLRSNNVRVKTVLAVLPQSNTRFFVVLSPDTSVPYGELWQGQLSPVPHLVKKLAAFPITSSSQRHPDVLFEAKHRRLWVVSADFKFIRSVKLKGPYTGLGRQPKLQPPSFDVIKSGDPNY